MTAPKTREGRRVADEQQEEIVSLGRYNEGPIKPDRGELAELQQDKDGNLKVTLPLVDITTVTRDGQTYKALVVDTELVLNTGNLTINNIQVGRDSGGTQRFLLVDTSGRLITDRFWNLASGTDSVTIGQLPNVVIENQTVGTTLLRRITSDTVVGQLPSLPAKKGVELKSDSDNVTAFHFATTSDDAIVSGDNTFALRPGESNTLEIDNANKLFYFTSPSGQILYVAAV